MSELFEIAIEDDRDIPIANSHLLRGACECGMPALHAPGQPSRCSECRRRDAGAGGSFISLAGRYGRVVPSAVADPTIVRETVAVSAFPAPEWTSRDGVEVPTPGVVLALVTRAEAAGWTVRVQCSRGSFPHGSTGRPLAPKTLHAAVLSLAGGQWCAYAVRDSGAWTSVMIWGADVPWFSLASITDLYEFVDARGEVAPMWFDVIRARVSGAEVRRKAREACNKGVHPLAEIQSGVAWCPTCLNSWPASRDPWRKPKIGKSEAL